MSERTSDGATTRADESTDPEPADVDVIDLSVRFDDVPVLENASMTASSGEFVGLVGPNGAGKTTLLRAVSGAIEPDGGRVTVGGETVTELSARSSSRLVSVVPQDTNLSFAFDVRDVVEMGRHPHRSRFAPPTAHDRWAVESALEQTRTARFADRSIDEVSGGERQRVLVARALCQETPIVLLDEPTANLDVNHQIETLELVRSLVDGGRTVVAAIHDLDLAARYCDRLVLLADGGVYAEGTPADVLTRDSVAAAFGTAAAIGANPTTGTPTVTALSSHERSTRSLGGHAHVLGSGPTAASVCSRLDTGGVSISLGPVTRGDAAAETANRLGIDRIAAEPFTPLDEATRSELEARVRNADVLVLTDPSTAATAAARSCDEERGRVGSKPVVLVSPVVETNAPTENLDGGYPGDGESITETTPEGVLDAVHSAFERSKSANADPMHDDRSIDDRESVTRESDDD